MTGRILKGVGGVYTVMDGAGGLHTCFARGRFRLEKTKPLVGDRVEFQPQKGEEDGYLLKILPRRNELRRPVAANVDLLALVAAPEPSPDWLLCDRLLADAARLGVEACLLFNKCDLASPKEAESALAGYGHLPMASSVSAATGQGLDKFLLFSRGKTLVLAGQSGVGKTSLLNRLLPEGERETGELSARISRGKNTTRHAELLRIGENTFAIDTPGFSLLEMEPMEPRELAGCYPDFAPYREECRFSGCLHDREGSCAVREAAEAGRVDAGRYERYKVLLAEVKELWRNRYGS